MDKKIGLEHTIREVMNKPADSSESKVGLEHAIRNVMTESIGGPNTDKFKGTPPSFLRPVPIIKPKVGDAHPDGTSAITQRGKDKIKSSETMKEEEQLDERAPRPPKGYVAPKPKAPAGIGPGNIAAPQATPWEKLTDIKDDGTLAGLGKDLLPVVGTIRQAKRTGEAYSKTADALSKGNYWDATKGAVYTAGQGVLTGVSAAGDVLTATGIGAAPVAAARGAIGAAKAASLASTVKGVVAGSRTGKATNIAANIPPTVATTTATTKTAPTATAPTTPKNAQFYNPKTGKTYKSKAESDIATKEFDLAAAAKVAGGKVQAAKQADVSVPKGDFPKIPPTAREPVAAPSATVKQPPVSATQKVSPAAREPAPFKPAEKPIEFKIASEPTSKGQVSVINREPPTPTKTKTTDVTTTAKPVSNKPLEGEIIMPSKTKQVAPAVSKPTKEITVDYKDVTPKTTSKTLVVSKPVTKTDTKTLVATRPEIKTKPVTKTDTKTLVATRPEVKTQTVTRTKTKEITPTGGKPPVRKGGGMIIPPLGLPSLGGLGDTSGGGAAGAKDVGTYLHRAGARRGDRFNEEIDPVAAETIKTKTRKAQIIRKVIDEQKKKKETSTVILNPKLKHQEADQN